LKSEKEPEYYIDMGVEIGNNVKIQNGVSLTREIAVCREKNP